MATATSSEPTGVPAARGGPPCALEDFSLVLGGPLYQLFLKTRLARPPLQLLHRRMLLIPALAWLPLLALTVLEGHAIGGVTVPFLVDAEAYARFLIALPILLLAESVVHQRLRAIILQVRERGIVGAAAMPGLEEAIGKAMRRRNSAVAEVALIVIVLAVGPWLWRNGLALQTDTWYARTDAHGSDITHAGWWFMYVSAPIFQFMLLRWYYRLAIWWRFLWQVSRLPLVLDALHPDRAGGIGFLAGSMTAFTPVLIAQSVVVSGFVFSRVLIGAGSAMDYRGEIVVLVLFLVAQVILPLLFFVPDLDRARRDAMRRFGLLATTYTRTFDAKWMQGGVPAGEQLVGSADIQSLADLAGSNDVLREMRLVPFGLRAAIRLAVATAVPFFPLVLTVVPFDELMQRVVKMLL